MIIEIIIITLAVIYAVLIIWMITGWLRLPNFKNEKYKSYNSFSIIIAARNEEGNICECLEALNKQDYPIENFEVIIIDDHSTDNTFNQAKTFININNAENFRVISLSGSHDNFGKKSALNKGIKAAKSDFIITTDADCKMGKNWLPAINVFINQKQPKMIIMPVTIIQEKTFFQKLQSLEFLSTAAVTGAAAGWGSHIMCNGANLCFSKKSFFEINGYSGNTKYASGDDIFLLHKMKKAFPDKIFYLKNKAVIVETKALSDIKQFFNQKKRWVSKSKAYKDFSTLSVAFTVGVFNIILVLSIIISIICNSNIWLCAWIIKIFADLTFLIITAGFFNKRRLLIFYPLAAILYPFYVLTTMCLGFKSGFYWKGRFFRG